MSIPIHTLPNELFRHLSIHLDALVAIPFPTPRLIQRSLPCLVASLQLWHLHLLDEAARILADQMTLRSKIGLGPGGGKNDARGQDQAQGSHLGEEDEGEEDGQVERVLDDASFKWLGGVLKKREAKEIRGEGSVMSIQMWHIQSSLLANPRQSVTPLIDLYFPSSISKGSTSTDSSISKASREDIYAARISSFRQSAKLFASAVRKFANAYSGVENELPSTLRAAKIRLPAPFDIPLEPMRAKDLQTGLLTWSQAILAVYEGLVRIGGVPMEENALEEESVSLVEAQARKHSPKPSSERKRSKSGLMLLAEPGEDTSLVLLETQSRKRIRLPSPTEAAALLPEQPLIPSDIDSPSSRNNVPKSTLAKPSRPPKRLTHTAAGQPYTPSRLALRKTLSRSELQDQSTTSGENSQSQRRRQAEKYEGTVASSGEKRDEGEGEEDVSGEMQWTASL